MAIEQKMSKVSKNVEKFKFQKYPVYICDKRFAMTKNVMQVKNHRKGDMPMA